MIGPFSIVFDKMVSYINLFGTLMLDVWLYSWTLCCRKRWEHNLHPYQNLEIIF